MASSPPPTRRDDSDSDVGYFTPRGFDNRVRRRISTSPSMLQLKAAVYGFVLSSSIKSQSTFQARTTAQQTAEQEQIVQQTVELAYEHISQTNQPNTSASTSKLKGLCNRCIHFKNTHKKLVTISLLATITLSAAIYWNI